MNGIIAFIAEKVPFVKRLWDAVDGYKTYLAGAGFMFTGISTMAGALAILVGQFAALNGFAADLAWAQGLKHDPTMLAIGGGWLAVLHGWTVIAQRHAADKAASAVPVAPAPVVAPPASVPAVPPAPLAPPHEAPPGA